MILTDVIDREVSGPHGMLRISAMYAALPPGIDSSPRSGSQRGRLFAEVVDQAGRRGQAVIEGDHARLLEPLDF